MIHLLWIILFSVIGINLAYWLCLFLRLLFHKEYSDNHNQLSASVIVVFKNEINDLQSSIQTLSDITESAQIILMNDFSTDGSLEYVRENAPESFAIHNARIDTPGKKQALKEAINASQTDIVVLTDVDCTPASKEWPHILKDRFSEQTDIVLGYSPAIASSGFLNRFIRFETWLTAVQYMSYAVAGMPYMGVGRNLAYRKSLAEDFQPDTSLASGDDDLFISAKATESNTCICLDPSSFVWTRPKESWSSFFSQKTRHVSTSNHYKWMHKILLGGFAGSQMLLIPGILLLIMMQGITSPLLVLTGMYVSLKWLIVYRLLDLFQEKDLWPYFPILDLCLSGYYWIMAFLTFVPGKSSQQQSWN